MKQRALILAAIELIESSEVNNLAVQADASANVDARVGARRAKERAHSEFAFQWQNVKAILDLADRLEKWMNANSEMRFIEVMEGESLRWHVRLKEITMTLAGDVTVAKFEAGTYEEALDGALKIVEADNATRPAGE